MRPVMMIITGAICLIVSLVMFIVALAQLTTGIGTVGAIGSHVFPGLASVMGVFGLVVFMTMIGAGLALIGFGTVRQIRGGGKSAGGGGRQRRTA